VEPQRSEINLLVPVRWLAQKLRNGRFDECKRSRVQIPAARPNKPFIINNASKALRVGPGGRSGIEEQGAGPPEKTTTNACAESEIRTLRRLHLNCCQGGVDRCRGCRSGCFASSL
jgi:hypothetical protein